MSSSNITKAEMIDKIVAKTGLSKVESRVAFDAVVDTVKEYISNGDRIELRGFGVFNHKIRQPRMARNPRTGEEVKLGARAVPTFKPSPDFQEQLNTSLKIDK